MLLQHHLISQLFYYMMKKEKKKTHTHSLMEVGLIAAHTSYCSLLQHTIYIILTALTSPRRVYIFSSVTEIN